MGSNVSIHTFMCVSVCEMIALIQQVHAGHTTAISNVLFVGLVLAQELENASPTAASNISVRSVEKRAANDKKKRNPIANKH